MGINYDPKMADNCWPAGDYDAELTKVESKFSKKSGNEMDELTIKLYNDDGRTQLTSDYFTAAAAFKIKQLAKSLGREAEFDAGTFQAENYIGAGFVVELSVEKSDEFGDRNKVKKYKAAQAAAPSDAPPQPYPRTRQSIKRDRAVASPIGEEEFKEADIPF